ncbi:PAS domain S-box-containing protein/diguanylate cyclase (GGDEF)-like protein [Edaphobacter aggregans]|uniref:PAS domain S-box-containing protein/diguanylate cyclase (GGDEF)-like protein n=2 Tax=Edaphobacter aggregans TaxID=570835 RepID=A0A3R9R553_9BACT|nr:PAS domain S-box-containing protein/diguanylate cyclase (GGDEF)-like protein [Edaphobacter aggregans]
MTVPVCLALGVISRQNHSLYAGVLSSVAGVGVLSALWSLWQENNRNVARKGAAEAHSKFLAAAETSLDAFSIFEAVRDKSDTIIDFRIQYVNANAEKMTGKTRSQLLGQMFSTMMPSNRPGGLFDRYRKVVETGVPLSEEFPVTQGQLNASWVRYQVVKLGDGLAITCSDISESKETQERYEHLVEFTDSVFQNAPFSIVATDTRGLITAMNVAAEKLTGYHREDLVGKAPLTILHDERELTAKAWDGDSGAVRLRDGFDILTAGVAAGEMEETEWTLIRRDGTRTPINLAVRAVTSDADEITGFVSIAFDITERRQMLDYVTHLATHDQLTGLLGRALLRDRTVEAVERARRYGTKVAVFMVDLDQFKRINDSLGHSAGDQLLVEAANRLRRSVRSTDVVARVGGDEFVVVMPDITSVADVEQCAANLVSKLSPEISIDEHLVNVTASVGVCIYPDFAADAKHLLKRADSAMYAAKENGRNQHQIFSEDMLKETADRLSMEHALRHALANHELSLHYQPQISLTTGAVTGMEALLRWTHPRLGEISPAQFIPLAEETGLIVPIGEWAFMTACREGKALQDELGMDLTVSVNLSPRQFQQRNLVQVIENSLAASGLAARSLEIEITENMLMVNSGGNLDKLQKIRELGARISIDDFGTGFCSFSYLLQYQVDRLKIDQSFVKQAGTDPNAAAVVRTIIAMSHGLNIRVVAEGVETDEQLRFLVRRKCDEAQGNFISRPAPARDFGAMLRATANNGAMHTANGRWLTVEHQMMHERLG